MKATKLLSQYSRTTMLTCAVMFMSTVAFAVDSVVIDGSKVDCNNTYTQAEMNQCGYAAYRVEDAKLNRVYRNLYWRLTEDDQQLLKTAQLAWIDFRDKACAFENREAKGGSIYSLLMSSCLTDYTAVRRKQLEVEVIQLDR